MLCTLLCKRKFHLTNSYIIKHVLIHIHVAYLYIDIIIAGNLTIETKFTREKMSNLSAKIIIIILISV